MLNISNNSQIGNSHQGDNIVRRLPHIKVEYNGNNWQRHLFHLHCVFTTPYPTPTHRVNRINLTCPNQTGNGACSFTDTVCTSRAYTNILHMVKIDNGPGDLMTWNHKKWPDFNPLSKAAKRSVTRLSTGFTY